MAPVLRSKVKKSVSAPPSSSAAASNNEKSNSDFENRRVPLPANIMSVLKKQMLLTINLNVNYEKEGKRPLTQGTKVLLPTSKALIANGMLPDYFRQKMNLNPVKDIRDDPTKKAYFLASLGLVEKKVAVEKESSKQILPLNQTLEKKLRSRKPQVVSFFKNNPLPLTSTLGMKIFDAGLGKLENPKQAIAKIEKYCSTSTNNNPKKSSSSKANSSRVLRSKSLINPISEDQYCHIYSFGVRERKKRHSALNMGLNERSYMLYSDCRDLSLRISRVDVQKAKAALKATQKGQKRKRPS